MAKIASIFRMVFTGLYWISLLSYLLPWVSGFHGLIHGSTHVTAFDGSRISGWDAFAQQFFFNFHFLGVYVFFILLPSLLYQIIYLVCSRKKKNWIKLSTGIILFFITLKMALLCFISFVM